MPALNIVLEPEELEQARVVRRLMSVKKGVDLTWSEFFVALVEAQIE